MLREALGEPGGRRGAAAVRGAALLRRRGRGVKVRVRRGRRRLRAPRVHGGLLRRRPGGARAPGCGRRRSRAPARGAADAGGGGRRRARGARRGGARRLLRGRRRRVLSPRGVGRLRRRPLFLAARPLRRGRLGRRAGRAAGRRPGRPRDDVPLRRPGVSGRPRGPAVGGGRGRVRLRPRGRRRRRRRGTPQDLADARGAPRRGGRARRDRAAEAAEAARGGRRRVAVGR
mmetsp:Transcript_12195/g.41577  ORF Transcript_12195/g.41577 Transcript_12195/m.41577 type:complete len:230 (-) Transcript_12195:285-974(-)